MSNWIPIKEKLPEPNKRVLFFLKDAVGETAQVVGVLFHSEEKELVKFNGEFNAYAGDGMEPNFLKKECVVAWTELPEPPTIK